MDNRQTKLSIDLGKEQVSIRRIDASEALGRPFSIAVEIIAAHGEIDLLPHLGKPAAVGLYEDDVLVRYFHGIVVEGEYLSIQNDGVHYRLLLRPWTYLMAQTRNFAIFQELSAIEIVKKVLGRYPAAKVDWGKLQGNCDARPYCVQYGESDFAFVTRLLEEEGIYYYFEHLKTEHKMVFCNGKASHAMGKPELLEYNPSSVIVAGASSAARSTVGQHYFLTSWRERVASGGEAKVTLRDFNFETAAQPLEDVSDMPKLHPDDVNEIYDWPGRYAKAGKGKPIGEHMLQALRANRRCFNGESQSLGLSTGRKFKLKVHPNPRFQNKDYLVTRTHHVTSSEHYRGGQSESEDMVFVEAVPAETDWQIMPTVPRPQVKGPETAIVTGPKDEEIFTDEYGRVKVRFHWDRSSSKDEESTCWIRVSQTGGLGNMILPRVGHEVIVDFLHGDPDRPIIVGRVYNSVNKPVYKLPENKTRALWRTKTYKTKDSLELVDNEDMDVEDVHANELRFEDKTNKEEVFLHAQRDMNTRVRYKESHHVGLDQEIKIGQDRKETLKRHDTVDIGGGRKVTVKEDDKLDVKKNITIDAGSEITMTATSKITLKVGSSKITIDPAGIKIEAPGTIDAKSAMTTVKADGILTLKGGMTMIN